MTRYPKEAHPLKLLRPRHRYAWTRAQWRICHVPESLACLVRIECALPARGAWSPEYAFGAAPVAELCATYVRDARTIRALADSVRPGTLLKLETGLECTHRLAREGLAQFQIIAAGHIAISVMNAEGVDELIAAL